jgi:soluble lytic murein transglycosylase-like protein
MTIDFDTITARKQLAGKYATKYGLPVAVLCALVEQESSWYPYAVRYEPLFFNHYIQPLVNNGKVPNATEAQLRATSVGLCQVMGQVARELGFTGRSILELTDPDVALEFGARKLAKCLIGQSMEQALLRYNGGGDPNYALDVLARVKKYEDPTDSGGQP